MTGAIAAALCVALFVCTAMIYACLRFIQEWAQPLTLVNFTLIGLSSGLLLASAFVAIENVLNDQYDVGRTPILTVGLPRAMRAGVQFWLP